MLLMEKMKKHVEEMVSNVEVIAQPDATVRVCSLVPHAANRYEQLSQSYRVACASFDDAFHPLTVARIKSAEIEEAIGSEHLLKTCQSHAICCPLICR